MLRGHETFISFLCLTPNPQFKYELLNNLIQVRIGPVTVVWVYL